jgi:cysteine desulfurase
LRSQGNHIITTTIEHPAVLRTCEQLEKEGFRVTYVPVDREGIVKLDVLAEAICEQTILISVMYVNNETGVRQPLTDVVRLAKERGILVHTDAVQAVGKISVDVRELGMDLLSLSAHKLHGPKGVGALFVRRGVRLTPLIVGGPHERSRRAGTENVPGIVGFGKVCELAKAGLDDFNTRVRALRDRLEDGVLSRIDETVVNGDRRLRAPHVTNLSFRFVEGEALLISLDLKGVAVSTGAACSSGSLQASHVLTAQGQAPDLIRGSVRFSLSRMNTDEEIDYVLEILPDIVARVREMSPLYRA